MASNFGLNFNVAVPNDTVRDDAINTDVTDTNLQTGLQSLGGDFTAATVAGSNVSSSYAAEFVTTPKIMIITEDTVDNTKIKIETVGLFKGVKYSDASNGLYRDLTFDNITRTCPKPPNIGLQYFIITPRRGKIADSLTNAFLYTVTAPLPS
jgi:hypothetical protein